MENQLIDVLVESDVHENTSYSMLAKISRETNTGFIVKFLSETNKSHEDLIVFNFEDNETEIQKECVDGYYDSTDPECAGYVLIDNVGYVRREDLDDDYSPSDDE